VSARERERILLAVADILAGRRNPEHLALTGGKKDLNELRKIAEAATQGEWTARLHADPELDPDCKWTSIGSLDGMVAGEIYGEMGSKQDSVNADYIATFDPPTVLALLDRIRELEGERDALTKCAEVLATVAGSLAAWCDSDDGFCSLEECGQCRAMEASQEWFKIRDRIDAATLDA
jgi:hypothetical protein